MAIFKAMIVHLEPAIELARRPKTLLWQPEPGTTKVVMKEFAAKEKMKFHLIRRMASLDMTSESFIPDVSNVLRSVFGRFRSDLGARGLRDVNQLLIEARECRSVLERVIRITPRRLSQHFKLNTHHNPHLIAITYHNSHTVEINNVGNSLQMLMMYHIQKMMIIEYS